MPVLAFILDDQPTLRHLASVWASMPDPLSPNANALISILELLARFSVDKFNFYFAGVCL